MDDLADGRIGAGRPGGFDQKRLAWKKIVSLAEHIHICRPCAQASLAVVEPIRLDYPGVPRRICD